MPSTGSDRLISRHGLVARHLKLGHSLQALIATLAHAVLREDAGFHAYQMLEAGVRELTEWDDTDTFLLGRAAAGAIKASMPAAFPDV